MGYCQVCSSGEGLPYTCNRCGGKFCSDHRLPESHRCRLPSQSISKKSPATAPDGSMVWSKNPGSKDTPESNWVSLLWLPVVVLMYTVSVPLRLLGWIFSPTGLKLVVVGSIVVLAISSTLGTGIAPVDNSTENATSSFATFVNESTTQEPINKSQIEQQVHFHINQERSERGLSPMQHAPRLREVARSHSEDMAQNGYFSHDSPSGEDFGDRYAAAGYNCRVQASENMYYNGAENIAYTYADSRIRADSGETIDHDRNETSIAKGLVSQWMNSRGHRENILRPFWNNEGIGIAITEDEKGRTVVYATQNFC